MRVMWCVRVERAWEEDTFTCVGAGPTHAWGVVWCGVVRVMCVRVERVWEENVCMCRAGAGCEVWCGALCVRVERVWEEETCTCVERALEQDTRGPASAAPPPTPSERRAPFSS